MMEQEVNKEIWKYGNVILKFLHSLCKLYYMKEIFDFLAFVIVINSNRFNEFEIIVKCSRLEYLHSTKTAKEYLDEQKEVNKTLLREYEDRLDHASTMEKTTMFSVEDHKLLIELSEEKWRSRKDLNEVEKKYFAQTRQNENKNQHVLEQKSKYAYHLVSTQIFNVKNLLFTAVETANKHRKNENNKEFQEEEIESSGKLNDAFSNYIIAFPYNCCRHLNVMRR
ncbi:polymorphic mucin variant [Schistosoma japonicum]|nr:polymorphic mucin variant [Schistosoma japonicum]